MDKERLNAFKDVIAFIEDCKKNKKGGYVIRQGQFGFNVESPGHPIIEKYGSSFPVILGEITNLTMQVLNHNESILIKDAEGKSPHDLELLQKKLKLIKERIINERLIRDYHFLNNCTTTVLKGISFQAVIKPTKQDFPDIISIITRVDLHNNQPEPKETSFIFELSPDQLEDVIKGFDIVKDNVSRLEETRNAEGKIEHQKAKLQ